MKGDTGYVIRNGKRIETVNVYDPLSAHQCVNGREINLTGNCDSSGIIRDPFPGSVLPESRTVHGLEDMLRFTAGQMQAFEEGSMWIDPLEYIEAGDRMVVAGRADQPVGIGEAETEAQAPEG